MNKILCFLFFAVLFIGCSVKEKYEKESERVLRLGVNGKTAFKNILQESAVTIDNKKRYTKYGHGEITFTFENENRKETFAIFSVPADSFVETYFNFVVEERDESYPWYFLCVYNKKSSQNMEYSVRKGANFVSVATSVTNSVAGHLIRVAGIFESYKQENLIVIGVDSLLSDETSALGINEFIISMTDEDKDLARDNTAYIVAYPWRTVRVLIEGGNSNTNARAVEWANENVFNQAIVRLELTSDSTNYEARIIATNSGDVAIYDEAGRIYQRFSSARPAFARVNTAEQRNFSYAVAFLLGVSLFEDERESNKTFHLNLMNRGEGDMSNRTHLSFRQWNQLHIRGER